MPEKKCTCSPFMEVEMKHIYDVIVVGGGPAGIMSAMTSGKLGASTLLIEKNGFLGG